MAVPVSSNQVRISHNSKAYFFVWQDKSVDKQPAAAKKQARHLSFHFSLSAVHAAWSAH